MSYTYLLVGALVAFGFVGYLRGWLREVASLAGLLVSWLIVSQLGGVALEFVNRLQLIALFILRDGYDAASPAAVIAEIRRFPLVEPRRPDVFLGVLFGALALVTYLAATRYVRGESSPSARALGVLVGLANGYVLTYLGLRFIAPAARLSLALPLGETDPANQLGAYLPTILVGGVILAIAIALASSKRVGAAGRASPNRAKS